MCQHTSRSFAINGIEGLLQVDRDVAQDIASYTLSLEDETEMQLHLLNLLGEGEEAFQFISNLLTVMRQEKMKNEAEDNKMVSSPSSEIGSSSLKPSGKKKPSTEPDRSADTQRPVQAQSESKKKTISSSGKKQKKLKFESLNDIEQVLSELEVDFNNTNDEPDKLRKCNCMGTRHKLFEVAPNCFNCGKIICAKEGLQPCSFCGSDILTKQERKEIMAALQDEKDKFAVSGQTTQTASPISTAPKKSKKIVVSMTAGQNLWDAQNKAFEKIEREKRKLKKINEEKQQEEEFMAQQDIELSKYKIRADNDTELVKAQERLETLLEFQDTGAERTKIIDNAADYELPNNSNGSIWLSPLEKALQLKKQQKQLRKSDRINDQRTGRAKKNVVMTIKNGKVVMKESYEKSNSDDDIDDEEINKLQQQASKLKLEKEKASAKDVWDYEGYNKRWERPIYKGDTPVSIQNDTSIHDRSRVQFTEDTNPDDLIVHMP